MHQAKSSAIIPDMTEKAVIQGPKYKVIELDGGKADIQLPEDFLEAGRDLKNCWSMVRQINQDFDDKKVREANKNFIRSHFLPVHCQGIREGLEVMEQSLPTGIPQSPDDVKQSIVDYFLIQGFLYQTKLKPSKKFRFTKLRHEEALKTSADNSGLYNKSDSNIERARESLQEKSDNLLKNIQNLIDNEIVDDTGLQRRIQVYDALVCAKNTYHFDMFRKLSDPKTFEKFMDVLGNTEFLLKGNSGDMLFGESGENLDVRMKIIIWMSSWAHGYDEQKLFDYFLKQSNYFQYRIWGIDDAARPLEGTDEEKICLFESFFTQKDTEILKKILSTVKLPENKEEKKEYVKELIAKIGYVKGRSENHENIPLLVSYAESLLQDEGLQSLNYFLDVVKDLKSGVIYCNNNSKVKLHTSNKGELPEDAVALVKKNGGKVIYCSKREEDDGKQDLVKENVPQKKLLEISGSIEHHNLWGEVFYPNFSQVPAILDWIGNKFQGMGEEQLFELLTSFSEKCKGSFNKSLMLISEFLPKDSPLAAFNRNGIRAIHQKGEDIDFILDAERVDIESECPKVVLRGKLNNVGDELRIEGADSKFYYSPLHLLLSSGVAFLNIPVTIKTFSKDQVWTIRETVKSWNKNNKDPHPILSFEPPYGSWNGKDIVLFPLHKDSVWLAAGPCGRK